MTLLTIIEDAAVEVGVPPPDAVIGSSDPTVALLLRLANKEGKELVRRYNWVRLTQEGSFVATDASATQVASITNSFSDFGRYINESMWNRTTSWPIMGPLDSLEWQQRQASGVAAGMGNWFRMRGNSILFYPTPTAGDEIFFDYISRNWCQSSSGVAQEAWVADADTGLLSEELMTIGVIWRFLKAKGLDYGEEFMAYEKTLEHFASIDGGKPVIDMTGQMNDHLTLTIPEGSWNQ